MTAVTIGRVACLFASAYVDGFIFLWCDSDWADASTFMTAIAYWLGFALIALAPRKALPRFELYGNGVFRHGDFLIIFVQV